MTARFRAFGAAIATVSSGIAMAVAPASSTDRQAIEPETATVAQIDPTAASAWVWVSDFVGGFGASRSLLFDASSGSMLGMLNTGAVPSALAISPDRTEVYSVETYFARGSRGARTDVVAVYDASTLKVKHEIEIPPKTFAGIVRAGRSVVLDDGRFLVSYNFNGGQSVSVTDLAAKRFVGEIETGGCAFAYPMGPRRFFLICGDGALLDVRLTDTGTAASLDRSARIADFERDLALDHAVRFDGFWSFVTLRGRLITVSLDRRGRLTSKPIASLADPAERDGSPLLDSPGAPDPAKRWQVSGLQPLAGNPVNGELFVLAQTSAARSSYQDGASEVFVFDARTGKRLRSLKLGAPATSIELTSSAAPALVAASAGAMTLEVYDPRDGKPLRSIAEAATAPLFLQSVGRK